MSRKPRELTLIGLYHVVVRGNSQQIIFEDDTDRYRLLSTLLEKSEDFGIKVRAWCLMSNHIHVLLDDPAAAMPQMMQGFLVSYSRYFNTKTGRTGHLFDGRYFSVAIKNDIQLEIAIDYIHLNPVEAMHLSNLNYRWSSFRAYAFGKDPFGVCEPLPLYGYQNGNFSYLEHMLVREYDIGVSPDQKGHLSDDDALSIATRLLRMNPCAVKTLAKEQRDRVLVFLRDYGLTVNQISRLCGVGRNTVSRATLDYAKANGSYCPIPTYPGPLALFGGEKPVLYLPPGANKRSPIISDKVA